jgi:fumarylacetoacetate (FAA) hydrolase
MKLCMFTPRDRELERGWPGRIDGDRVIQLAAQTLQSYFTGGGTAREHAEFPLDEVALRAPVLNPPAIRIFDGHGAFRFENTAAVFGPEDEIPWPDGAARLMCRTRVAAVIGAEAAVGGFTIYGEWHAPELEPPKDTDFARCLGPVVVTPDEWDPDGGWATFVAYAARNTVLRPGDLVALPAVAESGELAPGDAVELAVDGIGVLRNRVRAAAADIL